MKKVLLTLCIFLTAAAGQAFAASNTVASQDDVLTNTLQGNKRFSVSVSTGEGGQIEISGTGVISKNSVASATINTGEDVVLVITPDEGYELKTLYVDGADVIESVEEGTYTITAISKNMSISATFEELPEPTNKFDVDKDGTVNVKDVVSVYNYTLLGEQSGITKDAADVNGDESVNVTDVVEIYNYIIGGAE